MRSFLLGLGSSTGLNSCEEAGCGNSQGVAQAEQHIYRGRLFVVFQKADVRTVDLCRKGKLFLRHLRRHTSLSEFIAQHLGRVSQNEKRVC